MVDYFFVLKFLQFFFHLKKIENGKTSVLLHYSNTVPITTTLRYYDEGTGPSQPESEKRKSARHISVAEQLG